MGQIHLYLERVSLADLHEFFSLKEPLWIRLFELHPGL